MLFCSELFCLPCPALAQPVLSLSVRSLHVSLFWGVLNMPHGIPTCLNLFYKGPFMLFCPQFFFRPCSASLQPFNEVALSFSVLGSSGRAPRNPSLSAAFSKRSGYALLSQALLLVVSHVTIAVCNSAVRFLHARRSAL